MKRLRVSFVLIVILFCLCMCTTKKYVPVLLTDEYYLNIPRQHAYTWGYSIIKQQGSPEGIRYEFSRPTDDNKSLSAVVVSNHYLSMGTFLPDSIYYWLDNFGHLPILDDTLIYEGCKLLSADGQHIQRYYWKAQIIRNPQNGSNTDWLFIGYYGVKKRHIHRYEPIFNTYCMDSTFINPSYFQPLFDSLNIQERCLEYYR